MDSQNLRELREELERQTLSKYAMLSANATRARVETPCNVRTRFQRDRDRILYSKAFRRLMHKTQVFIAPEGDHYRTRLTHTIEVSQISRTVARALRLNEDLAEAIALGHDLGHAPFGHAGESALNKLMKKYTGKGFHHSQQSLRVVDYLERDGGLNLTKEVRNGIISHTKGKRDIAGPAVFEEPKTVEAQVVRIADRLAYINHDIDDAIRAGVIEEDDLPRECEKIFGRGISIRINRMILNVVKNSWDSPVVRMSDEMAKGLKMLKEFMFKNVYSNSPAKDEEYKTYYVISHIFDHLMLHPSLIPPVIVERGTSGSLKFAPEMVEDTKPEKSLDFDAMDSEDKMMRARTVCDYIAGMTDRYAVAIHKKFFVPRGWNIG